MDIEVYTATRRALHGVAELLLAGPQWRASRSIELRVLPGGFGTVAEPDVRVDGTELVHNGQRLALRGTNYLRLGAAAGLDAGNLADVYPDGSGAAPGDPVHVDPSAASYLAASLAAGDAALRALDPAATPVLWPEHFDVGIVLDAVNYGVSPGDATFGEPYAYVGPHDFGAAGERYRDGFWNAPFGAARPVRELAGETLRRFFDEGRERCGGKP
jgi:hypothetical protein